MINKESIKITLESFDHFVLSKAVKEIIATVKRTGAGIKGPIPFPTKIQKFCVTRSPHVDKDSREQYEIRTSKRIGNFYDSFKWKFKTIKGVEIPTR